MDMEKLKKMQQSVRIGKLCPKQLILGFCSSGIPICGSKERPELRLVDQMLTLECRVGYIPHQTRANTKDTIGMGRMDL